ncbi:MAG: hypothetical protein ABF290_11065 [Thiogranum sp.]
MFTIRAVKSHKGHAMIEELDAGKHDAVILDLAARLLDTARSLKFAVKADMVDDYDFRLLQSELQQYCRDAGRIASRVQGG